MNYASILLGIMFLLTFTVNIIVEVVKRLIPKVPTDILGGIVGFRKGSVTDVAFVFPK